MSEPRKFHRYAGVWEYRLAAWLIAHPFQQQRRFVAENDSSWETLDGYLGEYCSENASGRTLLYVLSAHRSGNLVTIDQVRTMPDTVKEKGQLNPRAILAKYWEIELSKRVASVSVDFRRLRYLLGNLHDALTCMDIEPTLWPHMARLNHGNTDEVTAHA
jgi:hypothetical protein